MKKNSLFLSLLLCVTFSIYPEKINEEGKQLIFGWIFAEEDTALQTNIAIEAALKYAEAARYQMNSYERYSPSCKMELYRENAAYYDGDAGVYVYINSGDSVDYHDRYIEISFYLYNAYNGFLEKYLLVIYYNNYNWLEKNNGPKELALLERGGPAFDFFVSAMKKFGR
ncbi:MAG: hypothetical protein LBI86_05415 [Treponema sp.]|jgi:hypothetical protein|nr:hypothetical protein [Treponema sp.]